MSKEKSEVILKLSELLMQESVTLEEHTNMFVSTASDKYDIEKELIRVKDKLTASQAECERLRGDNEGLEFVLEAILEDCQRAGIDVEVMSHQEMVLNLIDTLKAREAEANSYRDMYNELREALGAHDSQSAQNVLTKVERMRNQLDNGQQIFDQYNDLRKHWKNKYKRLVALLERESMKTSSPNPMGLLSIHRTNETKLKDRRKG